jgi:hypothetical protein
MRAKLRGKGYSAIAIVIRDEKDRISMGFLAYGSHKYH